MILLTGASGYLGSEIARQLIEQGTPFRVLARNPTRLPFDPAASQCEVITGDICDPAALGVALKDATCVIHSAGMVKMWARDSRDFDRINVEALKSLLEQSERAGVKRVVYTSSFMAAGPSSDPGAVEGLCNVGPYCNDYERTKSVALGWLRREGFAQFPVVAMLPGVIYGPGPATDGNLVGGMIDQFLSGKFPGLLGSGNQRWSFALNSEVARAHISALEKGLAGEEYFLAGDNRSLNELFELVTEQTGVKNKVRHLPFALGKLAGSVELARARLTGHSPQLTPGVVEIFRRDWAYSSAKAIREIDYRIVPLEQGLRRTLEARNG